jgi:vancomycin permeability regulator SanA
MNDSSTQPPPLPLPSRRKKVWWTVSGAVLLILTAPLWLVTWVARSQRDRVFRRVEEVPPRRVAIVFGAAVYPGGQLSHVLDDRVQTSVELYQAGKVQKLLMTGDNSRTEYNEPVAMKSEAIRRGVPEEDVILDYAGFRTYDSCYRARDIFGLREGVLVTQRFHLPRALYTARKLGLDVVGLAADRRPYVKRWQFAVREQLALLLAWWELNVTRPRPHFLGPFEPIFPEDHEPVE